MSEFELIRTEVANHTASVKRMCRLLGVSRSGYYGHVARRLDPPPSQDDRLVAMMRAIQAAYKGAYSVRRMHREMVEAGEMVGRKRVRRLIRERGIRAVQTPRFTKTTDSKHDLGYALNLLQQDHDHGAGPRLSRRHHVHLDGRGVVLPCHVARPPQPSCRRLGDGRQSPRPCAARATACSGRSQSGSRAHLSYGPRQPVRRSRVPQAARKVAVRSEHERRGHCYDNAAAESFFASLKKERLRHAAFGTRTEAYDVVESYIEGFYNPTRRHSALGCVSPLQYEREAVSMAA